MPTKSIDTRVLDIKNGIFGFEWKIWNIDYAKSTLAMEGDY